MKNNIEVTIHEPLLLHPTIHICSNVCYHPDGKIELRFTSEPTILYSCHDISAIRCRMIYPDVEDSIVHDYQEELK
jgi:hypothetical protein